MINKKNLWFLTLFSLVLVLSIYYVSIPSELLVSSNGNIKEEVVSGDKDDTSNVSIEESDMISALKVEDNANTLESINKLKETLTNPTTSIEDKNKAFEELKTINNIASEEETLLLAVVPTRSYFRVKEGLKEIDNNIFFLVCDSYEVSDNGDLS